MNRDLQGIIEKSNHAAKAAGLVLFLVLFFFGLTAVGLGRADLSAGDVLEIIAGQITGNGGEGYTRGETAIVWDVRLPRILAAMLVGSGLAVSGGVFQSMLMNPLADSYTMGVSSGAAFGAAAAIYVNIYYPPMYIPITAAAFAGALLTLLLVMAIAGVKGRLSSANLVIAGIIVSSILSAGISVIKNASDENVSAIVYWLMGSLSARGWNHVFAAAPVLLAAIFVCIYFSGDLNLMSLGEREARFLGVDTQKMRRILLVTGSLITAVCVSVSGIIGFVGLIVPHMVRFLVGSDNRKVIPLSALAGALLLLAADTAARTLLDVELPVGVLTTLLGGPFFIYIFIRNNNSINL